MITFDEFIAKWNGKPLDFDKAYGAQCFDLYRQYCQDVLGVPQSPPTGDKGAKTIWDTYLQDYFDRIPNSPTGYPEKGDIMIWGGDYGPYGHVAVVTEATVNTFKCFSQNDPTGALCGVRWYKSYAGVLGWLRVKVKTTPVDLQKQIDDLQKEVADKNVQISNYVDQLAGSEKKYSECLDQFNEAKANAEGFRKQHNEFVASLAQKLDTRQETVEILAAIDTLITYEDKALELDRQIAIERKDHASAVEALERRIAGLESDLVSLKKDLQNVKDNNLPVVNVSPKFSIIELIKKLIGAI